MPHQQEVIRFPGSNNNISSICIKVKQASRVRQIPSQGWASPPGLVSAVAQIWRVCWTVRLTGLLCISGWVIADFSCLVAGLELTFYSGVYGTCIGAMNQFGDDAKSLIGLSGIFIGMGEILGGGVFGMLNTRSRFGRNPVVLLGLLTHFVAFYLIFLNIAADAPIAPEQGTNLQAFMIPSVEVALLCSFLLGLGDSCFNTQLLSIVGFMFPQDSAPAFAIFKFIQSISAAVAFFYSNYLLLHWQLLIMVLTGFLGTLTFFTAERVATAKRHDSDYDSI